MPVELKVPAVGESITEVQIGEWMKAPGELARADEGVVVIETDKVTVELPAPVSGRITKVLKQRGDAAKVGEVIGFMEEGAADGAPAATPKAAAPKAAAATAATAKTPATPAAEKAPESATTAKTPANSGAPVTSTTAAKPKATPSAPAPAKTFAAPTRADATRVMPAAARALAEAGVEADDVSPSGPGGRLLKEDVQRHVQSAPASAPSATAIRDDHTAADGREEEVVPMTPLRKRIAQRLVEAQQTAAILTTFNEIDMTAVMALRKQHQERFLERYQVKLGFMSFFVKASIEALKKTPNVNAEVRGDSIVYRNYYDIGIAVGGGKGLVVPIIRNAERLSFAQIEVRIGELGARAKDNKLTLAELTGGTFTISNGGIYGSLMSTPILNPPQSGILGLHAIQDRPVAIDGQVVIRPMMYVALSYDHRVVDGREAVTFLKTIKECVEEPSRILLEI